MVPILVIIINIQINICQVMLHLPHSQMMMMIMIVMILMEVTNSNNILLLQHDGVRQSLPPLNLYNIIHVLRKRLIYHPRRLLNVSNWHVLWHICILCHVVLWRNIMLIVIYRRNVNVMNVNAWRGVFHCRRHWVVVVVVVVVLVVVVYHHYYHQQGRSDVVRVHVPL